MCVISSKGEAWTHETVHFIDFLAQFWRDMREGVWGALIYNKLSRPPTPFKTIQKNTYTIHYTHHTICTLPIVICVGLGLIRPKRHKLGAPLVAMVRLGHNNQMWHKSQRQSENIQILWNISPKGKARTLELHVRWSQRQIYDTQTDCVIRSLYLWSYLIWSSILSFRLIAHKPHAPLTKVKARTYKPYVSSVPKVKLGKTNQMCH